MREPQPPSGRREMGTGNFEFEYSDSEARIRGLGAKLLHAVKQIGVKKDALVKLLRVRGLPQQHCFPRKACIVKDDENVCTRRTASRRLPGEGSADSFQGV